MSKKPAIFSEKQQQKTLSAKLKKPTKIQLKNVLVQPLVRYWPLIKDAESNELFKQWQILNISQKRIIRGLNATVRSLKQGKIQILLISADIKPKYIVEQIILLALGHNPNVRILCVPNLSEQLSSTFSFTSCICVSFLNCEFDDNAHFKKFDNIIVDLSAQFQSSSYLEKNRNKINVQNKIDIDKVDKNNIMDMQTPISFNELYLTKSKEKTGRQFVPNGTVFMENPLLTLSDSSHQEWGDFLSLSTKGGLKSKDKQNFEYSNKSTSLISKIIKKNKKFKTNSTVLVAKQLPENAIKKDQFKYVTLKVNKIQPNQNKIKKNKKQKKK